LDNATNKIILKTPHQHQQNKPIKNNDIINNITIFKKNNNILNNDKLKIFIIF
jgi:hypothetical protein